MKTNVTKTSIDAYYTVDLPRQETAVLNAISQCGEICIADLAEYMGWERSTVSARMNGLKKRNLIRYVGKRRSKATGIMSQHWDLTGFRETLF